MLSLDRTRTTTSIPIPITRPIRIDSAVNPGIEMMFVWFPVDCEIVDERDADVLVVVSM